MTKPATDFDTPEVSVATVSVVVASGLALTRFSVTPSIASVTVFDALLIAMPSIVSDAFCAATLCSMFRPAPTAAAGS